MNPAAEYRARLDDRRQTFDRALAADARLSYARLAVFGGSALVAWLAFWHGAVSGWWLLPPAAIFLVLMKVHDGVIKRRDASNRSIAFYERGLARIEDRWRGGGETGDRFRNDDHPYANDLDLFGSGSLFELLSIARTRAGEEVLAGWLTTAGAPDLVRIRQHAVDEMTPRLDLREALALAGADVRAGVDTALLVEWAKSPAELPRWMWSVAGALSVTALAAALHGVLTGNWRALIIVGLVELVAMRSVYARVKRVLHVADKAVRDLDIVAHVLQHLERARFASERLAALRASLDTRGAPASALIRRLHRLSEMHDWEHNLIFAVVAAPLLWGTHLAFAVERWRARYGTHVPQWLTVVGEFEAFGSLSAYRYEHPNDVFAEIVEGPASFDGTALGHPLLPAAQSVPNDVRLAGDVRLLVVSGSNMSGKSTLLRTVGINAVLAQAGAPVRASRLRMTSLAIGATLRIQDSLQEGRSRFYAEITRIRRLADIATGARPLLFLLDELFHGTNSHDRRVGATGVLRGLIQRGAIGLVTTHDLALTRIADDLAPQAVNVHFDDTFDGRDIRFDYQMKPGAVTRSNAIALMRAVGLDVPADDVAGAADPAT